MAASGVESKRFNRVAAEKASNNPRHKLSPEQGLQNVTSQQSRIRLLQSSLTSFPLIFFRKRSSSAILTFPDPEYSKRVVPPNS